MCKMFLKKEIFSQKICLSLTSILTNTLRSRKLPECTFQSRKYMRGFQSAQINITVNFSSNVYILISQKLQFSSVKIQFFRDGFRDASVKYVVLNYSTEPDNYFYSKFLTLHCQLIISRKRSIQSKGLRNILRMKFFFSYQRIKLNFSLHI